MVNAIASVNRRTTTLDCNSDTSHMLYICNVMTIFVHGSNCTLLCRLRVRPATIFLCVGQRFHSSAPREFCATLGGTADCVPCHPQQVYVHSHRCWFCVYVFASCMTLSLHPPAFTPALSRTSHAQVAVHIQYCTGYKARFDALSSALLAEFNGDDFSTSIHLTAEAVSTPVFEVFVSDTLIHSTASGQVRPAASGSCIIDGPADLVFYFMPSLFLQFLGLAGLVAHLRPNLAR
jgi:hypothetical protein